MQRLALRTHEAVSVVCVYRAPQGALLQRCSLTVCYVLAAVWAPGLQCSADVGPGPRELSGQSWQQSEVPLP